MEKRRGLIIFPGALGDLVCLLPAIRELSQRHLTIEFELMARAELARFAERRMRIVAGHSIDRREVALLFSEPGSESDAAHRFFSQFDRIECFFASGHERFCASLERASTGEVCFYPFRPGGTGHVAECYLRAIGVRAQHPLDNSIELTPADLQKAECRLRALGLEPGRFVLVLPGSGSASKNWPAENFALLAERIRSFIGVLILLGPAEARLESIFRSRALSVINDIELGESGGIARLVRCFIGNDSGVSHLAAAVGARGLVLFGPTDPERWRPLGDVRIIRKQPLEALLVGEVWPTITELIAGGH
ncbi:MAG: glycosyltransferase family 9 protein [Deltaproteobacteria bacterium]|nr:glycosyltransferase family 9 protein [Deltaproteobacteria bacterium]